ncbi:alpha/beta fold hydrolase [Streptomyces fuscichromogenes]|uniref:Alpha/beta hydrolase n=1 Tax=Streptomyces fuscichromogenes TaxID=1324013 RepID=A0A917XA49_9ACTN|nr:alpha/beta hydrolase [Streptomyces fuscichromogenes]GGM99912.1 alpha/beta hydrolase [Streptomyces fuscichromogenes]
MSTTPTIVLVHGAFGDSGMWKGVIAKLQAQGYTTLAVSNPLRGLESDAQYAATVAETVDGPVVLVGHSYAGAIITRAARDASNVEALVYVAAFQPDEGESCLENAARFPGAKMGPDTTVATEHEGEPELRILPEHYRDVIAGDLPAEVTDVLAVTQRSVRVQALTAELSGRPAWRTLPSWAVIATQDNAIPGQAQEFMAERAGSHVVRVAASHAVAISQPDAVADLVIEAAKATR